MSLVVDSNLVSWESFDVQTATTLFWKRVPFVYKASDREDVHEDFTVRILKGVAKNQHNLHILRIHISTTSDLLFLHTLEVTEDDFQCLKAEQGILVDFAHFPAKLMTLLEKCIDAEDDAFQAELTMTSGKESCLKIVETNDFNKLPHVSLKFRPGNDAAVKAFLAFRLGEVTDETHTLQADLTESNMSCEKLREELKKQEERWSDLKEKYETIRLEANAERKKMHLDSEEKVAETREALKTQLDEEKREAEGKLTAQIERLMQRHQELEVENQQLRDAKYSLDKQCSEMHHRLAAMDGELTHLRQLSREAKDESAKLAAEKQQLMLDQSASAAEIRALTEKVCSVEGIVDVQKNRIADLEASKQHLEKLCDELKSTSLSHEKSGTVQSQELKEAKFVIQKMARDLHLAKEKHCHLRAILSRQEDLVSHQSRQLKEAEQENMSLEQNFESLRRENESLKNERQELMKNIEDSAAQLKKSEGMIEWLHKQMNESATQKGRPFFRRGAPYGSHSVYSLPRSTSSNIDHPSQNLHPTA